MCKAEAFKLSQRRRDFAARGVKLVAVSPILDNYDEFRKVSWPDDELYIDEGSEFKKALGDGGVATKISMMSLLWPSVIKFILSSTKYGSQNNDIGESTLTHGGTIVIRNSEVLFAEAEASAFVYPAVDSVLAACPAPAAAAADDAGAAPAVASSAA